MNWHNYSIYLLTFVFFIACESKKEVTEVYKNEIESWKNDRLKYLRGETGFVNLAGLFWLQEGENSFGGSEQNHLPFPKERSKEFMGVFRLSNDSVYMIPSLDVRIHSNDELIKKKILAYHDSLELVPEFEYGTLRWVVIKRGEKYGIRLRDLQHPSLSTMEPIEFFPLDPYLKLEATYEKYDSPKFVKTANVLGMMYDAKVPGLLKFKINGKQYEMEPNIDGDKLHLRFTDETTGVSTYGLGRYLHIDMPEASGPIVVDFNRSYNPPCAFTEFATCPIPPKQNHIAFALEVGEKDYHEF